ncbi:PX domain-containing protein EREL1-like [Impatiens glandulifera]|uniref:PX domain-containing protein EREL1-like n=1 Tax=Impatiens glandulifera TaxID=253017 RepID=UPI001FB10F28|nr:PX domain-containing protein EREL1-like [Impatiens glandulifera]
MQLKKAFPKKDIPPAPPKGLLKLKNKTLLEERRSSLEGWILKLLSDIELSRSAPVASFLELEAAARSSFQNENQQDMETSPTGIACETSEIESPILVRDNKSEIGLEVLSLDGDDVGNPIEKFVKYGISNIDEGLFMGHAILEQIDGFQKHKPLFKEIKGHSRKLSTESNVSSTKSSELSNSNGDGHLVNCGGNGLFDSIEIVLPIDQRQKMDRILLSMQRRLLTAKTDMEDLITRLSQEIMVNDYLVTKVNDLEVELEATKQTNKESLQQTIQIERERVMQMQWDMEELRQKSFELELKIKSQQEGEILPQEQDKEPESFAHEDDDVVLQELDSTKKQLEDLLKRHEELQLKSKADLKVLIKEIKSLRNSQRELKQEVSKLLKENSVSQELLEVEKQRNVQINRDRRNLLNECKVLVHRKLLKCMLPEQGEDLKLLVNGSADLNLLETSDHQICGFLAKVESLAESDAWSEEEDETRRIDREMKRMLANMLSDNVKLRKEIISSTMHLT